MTTELERICDVREVRIRLSLQPCAEVKRSSFQRRVGLRRQRKYLPWASNHAFASFRCLLEQYVRVRAADSEGIDTRTPPPCAVLPLANAVDYEKRTVLKINIRIRILKVQTGW